MDTRDQTLTKLTRLHGKSHPTHQRPASIRWNYSRTAVSIMKLVMEDGDGFPSPKPRTDSRSALLREIRAWWQLRIVKRDESFSLIFFSPNMNIWSWSWGRWSSRGPTRQGARLPPSWEGCGPPGLHLWWGFFIVFSKMFREVSSHSENFYFCKKITPWQFCWKQCQSGLVPFKSCKLESKTRAKVFEKVDTTETCQLPQA